MFSSNLNLDKGKMEVIIHEQSKKYLHPGDGFGELALLYNAPRSATCRAIDDCYLWAINRATFKKAVTEMITKEYQENRKFIEDISFFSFSFDKNRLPFIYSERCSFFGHYFGKI